MKNETIANKRSGLVQKRHISFQKFRVKSVNCVSGWEDIWQGEEVQEPMVPFCPHLRPLPQFGGGTELQGTGVDVQLCGIEGSSPNLHYSRVPEIPTKPVWMKDTSQDQWSDWKHWHIWTWQEQWWKHFRMIQEMLLDLSLSFSNLQLTLMVPIIPLCTYFAGQLW